MSKLRQLAGLGAIAVIIAVVSVAVPRVFPFLGSVELWLADLRIALLTPAMPPDRNIVVLQIQESTIADLPYRSPIDRGLLSDILDSLARAGVRAVGIDILFERPTEPEKDARLRDRMRNFPAPIVVAWTDAGSGLTERQFDYMRDFLGDAHKGYADLLKDPDGIVRWIFPGRNSDGEFVPSFPWAIAKAVGTEIPDRLIPLAYRRSSGKDEQPFRIYPAEGAAYLPPSLLKGRIVLIGTDLAGTDRHRTPLVAAVGGAEGKVPGVLIHAHALSQILDQRSMPIIGFEIQAATAFAFALIGVALAALYADMFATIFAGVVAVAVLWVGGFALFAKGGPLVPLFMPTLGLGVAWGISSAIIGRGFRAQMRQIRHAFNHYVTPALLKQIQADPSFLKLGGVRREMTFIFTDVMDFTTLTERLDPEVMMPLLHDYLDGMSGIVLKHKGTIDKFVGDAVIAFFGAPGDQPDHAARAVACALDLDRFAESFIVEMKARGIDFGVTRIGVHTGNPVVGNFGGRDRFDYTAMGDTVNTASRLEAVNKYLGTRICVGGTTKAECPDFEFRPVGNLVLKGKSESVEAFEPLTPACSAESRVKAYCEAFDLLRNGDTAARDAFARVLDEAPDDPLASFHLSRLNRGATGVTIEFSEK